MPDDRSWASVQHEACAECGLDAPGVPEGALAAAISDVGRTWVQWLSANEEDLALARRPEPEVWAALEYAGHTRDVLVVFAGRVQRVLDEDAPELGWWDHEAAAVERRYADQDPLDVGLELLQGAEQLATVLEAVAEEAWVRTGTRRGTEVFTVAGLGRFALHEATHHLQDAERSLDRAAALG